MSRIEEALQIALEAHNGQKRKVSGMPFIIHLMDVMKFLTYEGASEDVIIAGILHDILEDTNFPKDQIRNTFGEQVTKLVEFATEEGTHHSKSDKELQETWKERKQNSLQECAHASEDELLLKLADKLANITSIRDDLTIEGEHTWSHFNATKEQQEWYFTSFLEIIKKRLPKKKMRKLYEVAVEEVFKKKES